MLACGTQAPSSGESAETDASEASSSGSEMDSESDSEPGSGSVTGPPVEETTDEPETWGDGDGEGPDPTQDDIFDPAEVYIVGSTIEALCSRHAIIHWSTPSDAALGFDCDFYPHKVGIRPHNGRMLYASGDGAEFELREFYCDFCPYSGGVSSDYPSDTPANDPIVPTPACGANEPKALEFLIEPGSGDYLYRCGAGWYDGAGELHYDHEYGELRHLGYGSLALTQEAVVDLSEDSAALLDGLVSDWDAFDIRAEPDRGFLLARGTMNAPELWRVTVDAKAIEVGTYPPAPAEIQLNYGYALDPQGVLFQRGRRPETGEDVLLRRELGGATEIVYDEGDDPIIKWHGSFLLTGP